MNSFIDTNIAISYSFNLDSFNKKAKTIFKKYHQIYWSKTTKDEFEEVFISKKEKLKEYYNQFFHYLGKCTYFNENQIEEYIQSINPSEKNQKNLKKSLSLFWDIYFKNKYPKINDLKKAVAKFLLDLNVTPYENRKKWEKRLN